MLVVVMKGCVENMYVVVVVVVGDVNVVVCWQGVFS